MDYIIKNEASLDSKTTQDGLKDILSYIKETRSVVISYTRITDLCTKYKLEVPATTNILIALEVQDDSLDIDAEVADYIDENFAPDYQRDADFYMSWYNDFLKEGKIGPKSATFLFKRLAFEEDKLITTVNVYNKARIEGDGFFYGLKDKEYKTIDDVPEGERDEARQKLFAYLKLREQLYSIESRLLGVYSGMDLLGKRVGKAAIDVAKEYGLIPADLDKTKEVQNEDLTVHESGTQELVEFLKVKDYKTPDREILAISPLHAPLLMPELKPIMAPLAEVTANVAGKYKGLEMVGKRFEQYPDMPKSYRSYTSMWDLFTMGKKDFTDLLASISTSREKVGTLQTDVRAKLAAVKGGTHEIVKKHPELKGILEKMFGNLDTQLTWLLTDGESPLSSKNEGLIKESQVKFNEQFDEFAEKEFWNIVKIAAIMVVVIGAAVAGGVGAAAIATHFGLAGGGLASTLAITGVTSLGGVIGSRVGMLIVDGVAYAAESDPVFGMDQIFDPVNFARDFAIGWGMSFAAVSMARFVMFKSEAWSLGKAGLFKTQYAGKAGAFRQAIGRGVLDKAKILQTIADPSKWFAGGKAAAQQAALKHAGFEFGERYVKENLQEYVESAGDAINPVLGFFLSVANSSDGINIELSRAGFDPQAMGLKVEDGALSYTTATAQEFVANVEAKFRASGVNSDFTTSVNPDGTVVVDVTPKTAKGELDYAHAVKVEVKPANTGLSPDVEMARVQQKFNLQTNPNGTVSVNNADQVFPLMDNLDAQGFVLTETPNGFKATKGSIEMTVDVPAKVAAEMKAKMESYNAAVVQHNQRVGELRSLSQELKRKPTFATIKLAFAKLSAFTAGLTLLVPRVAAADGVDSVVQGAKTFWDGALTGLGGLLTGGGDLLGGAGQVFTTAGEVGLAVGGALDIALLIFGTHQVFDLGGGFVQKFRQSRNSKAGTEVSTEQQGQIIKLEALLKAATSFSGVKISGDLTKVSTAMASRPVVFAANDQKIVDAGNDLRTFIPTIDANLKRGLYDRNPRVKEAADELTRIWGDISSMTKPGVAWDQGRFDTLIDEFNTQKQALKDATAEVDPTTDQVLKESVKDIRKFMQLVDHDLKTGVFNGTSLKPIASELTRISNQVMEMLDPSKPFDAALFQQLISDYQVQAQLLQVELTKKIKYSKLDETKGLRGGYRLALLSGILFIIFRVYIAKLFGYGSGNQAAGPTPAPSGGLPGPQGGTVGPSGGLPGPSGGGTVGPSGGGTVGPSGGGTVGPSGGGTVGPQGGGTVAPQGGLPGSQSGTAASKGGAAAKGGIVAPQGGVDTEPVPTEVVTDPALNEKL